MTVLLSLPLLIGLIAVALAFDLLNGLHDTANSNATIVSTRMLRPRYAVVWAAFSISSRSCCSACTWREPSASASSLPTSWTRASFSAR